MSKPTRATIVAVILLLLEFQATVHPAYGYSFNGPIPVVISNGTDFYPTSLQTSSGKLWLAWESSQVGQSEIYYSTYDFPSATWSTSQNLTGGPQNIANQAPSLAQLRNGSITLIWSSNQTGHYNLYYKLFTGSLWTKSIRLTSGTFDDLSTRALVSPNGTLWTAWSRQTTSTSCMLGFCRQIYYKTLNGNDWSTDIQLTSDSAWSIEPGLMVAKNRNIWATYSKCSANPCTYNIFSQTNNGTTWSSPYQLTSPSTTTFGDENSEMAVDRNGTVWMLWSRDVNLGGGVNENKLFYENSSDGGSNWTQPTQLTFTGTQTMPVDDVDPSIVQAADQRLWLFFSSDPESSGFNIYYFQTNPVYPVHDVAVTNVAVGPNFLIRTIVNVSTVKVTVSDLGDFLENVNLTVRATGPSSFVLGRATGLFGSGSTFTFTFQVNQTSLLNGRYTITASISPLPGESVGGTFDDSLQYTFLTIVKATNPSRACSIPRLCPI